MDSLVGQQSITVFILLLISVTSFATIDETKLPPECRRLGICEEVLNYPEDVGSNLLEMLKSNNTKFNEDIIEKTLKTYFRTKIDFEEETLCESDLMIFTPRAARNKNGRWHYILNPRNKEDSVQTFRVETCPSSGIERTENEESSEHTCSRMVYFGKYYVGQCVQKYILREMYAISESGNNVIVDHFQIPSCCMCVARKRN